MAHKTQETLYLLFWYIIKDTVQEQQVEEVGSVHRAPIPSLEVLPEYLHVFTQPVALKF